MTMDMKNILIRKTFEGVINKSRKEGFLSLIVSGKEKQLQNINQTPLVKVVMVIG